MISWAKIGQRVVCIHVSSRIHLYKRGEVTPYLGQVLTIRDIDTAYDNGEITFRFEEIRNPVLQYSNSICELNFRASFFKPVKETSIDCFTQLLENIPVDQHLEEV